MAKYREIPCKYYEAFGLCQKRAERLPQNLLPALRQICSPGKGSLYQQKEGISLSFPHLMIQLKKIIGGALFSL